MNSFDISSFNNFLLQLLTYSYILTVEYLTIFKMISIDADSVTNVCGHYHKCTHLLFVLYI